MRKLNNVSSVWLGRPTTFIEKLFFMTRNIKISILWLLTISGFACHSICDVLPMFWGQNMAVAASDGNVDYGMIVFMMILSFFIPACGVLCVLWKRKVYRVVNALLAAVIGLFNIAHAFMELPSDNAGQYVVLPMMIIIGNILAWNSIKYVKEG